ncbi:MAG: hypothetical protein HY801_11110 [Candidatus Lindowbacteria bacterium]|nr:hypothetical protein [Candidatus Lindowbacteria bacterium]
MINFRYLAEPLTVTGKLRVGPYREIGAGMEIDLDSVRYKEMQIRTDQGPFVQDYYYYPYHGPLLWDPWFPHYRYW